MKQLLSLLVLAGVLTACSAQNKSVLKEPVSGKPVTTGAERPDLYLNLVKGKRVALFANHTSMVGPRHLVDTLQRMGVDVKVIFGPEHGFRGDADAGEKVANYIDKATGIPVVSLYGSKRLPDANDLRDIDLMIFDIQDVGTRFYTYISSLEEYIQAAIEHKKDVLVLDRPNPNAHYVDGPVLQSRYKSFVGMQEVPIVYGMTIGEYANFLVGEKLIKNQGNKFVQVIVDGKETSSGATPHIKLFVVTCDNYDHQTRYDLPYKPSPNLPNMQSVYLYPSTCLFEGTVLSEGRGTDKPFQVFGHPSLPNSLYAFTPNPNAGAKSSKNYGQVNYGWDLSGSVDDVLKNVNNQIQLKWLMDAYHLFPDKEKFIIKPKDGDEDKSFFNKLAGNGELWTQIKAGVSEAEIRKSWEPALRQFKEKRKKYLFYKD